jgi:hypothetical protein
MPWVKIDDNFSMHPKVMAAGGLATLLFIEGLCYCARHLTDGFIPEHAVLRMVDPVLLDLYYQGGGTALMVADKLIDVGLWEQADGGYTVHDYLDYNPSGAKVRAEREAHAQRMADWREKKERGQARGAIRDTPCDEDVIPSQNGLCQPCDTLPVPVPVPVPQDHVCKNLDSNRDMGGDETPPARSKQKRTPKPTTPPPEAVKIVQTETHRYPPKSWFGTIADTVGTEPDNLTRWRRVVHAWVGSGYNPQNVQGMLDAYKRNEIPSTKGSGDAGNGKAPTSIPVRVYE